MEDQRKGLWRKNIVQEWQRNQQRGWKKNPVAEGLEEELGVG